MYPLMSARVVYVVCNDLKECAQCVPVYADLGGAERRLMFVAFNLRDVIENPYSASEQNRSSRRGLESEISETRAAVTCRSSSMTYCVSQVDLIRPHSIMRFLACTRLLRLDPDST
jgi:hypothetical protein